MLRTDMNTLVAWLKDHVRPTVADMRRGHVQMDAAGFHGLGISYADGQRIGTVMGLDITRLAALADNHMDYYLAESTTLIHTV